MIPRTFDQVVKAHMGDMAFVISQMTAANDALRAENEDLKAKIHQLELAARRTEPDTPTLAEYNAIRGMSTTQRPS